MRTAERSLRLVGARRGAASAAAAESRSPDKYQVIFEQASDAIITVHPDGRIDSVNRAAEELFGWMRAELVGQKAALFVPDSVLHPVPRYAKAFREELLQESGTYEDVAIARKDGLPRTVDVTVRTIAEEGVLLSVVFFRDFTEKRQVDREVLTKQLELRESYLQLQQKNVELQAIQERLVEARKLAALGEMTAGIAHEIKNPLNWVRGYAQELGAILPVEAQSPEVRDSLGEIIHGVDRIVRIIDDMRTLARVSLENIDRVDAHAVIDRAIAVVSSQVDSSGIEFSCECRRGGVTLAANAGQLEQVFVNLLSNARDAVVASGRSDGRISVRASQSGERVEFEVADNGIGMDEQTRAKIFNPFFTTKDAGKGTGLGLSISHRIIGLMQGTISVESEPGRGTKFIIRFARDFRAGE